MNLYPEHRILMRKNTLMLWDIVFLTLQNHVFSLFFSLIISWYFLDFHLDIFIDFICFLDLFKIIDFSPYLFWPIWIFPWLLHVCIWLTCPPPIHAVLALILLLSLRFWNLAKVKAQVLEKVQVLVKGRLWKKPGQMSRRGPRHETRTSGGCWLGLQVPGKAQGYPGWPGGL